MKATLTILGIVFLIATGIVLTYNLSVPKEQTQESTLELLDNKPKEEENYNREFGMALRFYDDTHSLTNRQLTHIVNNEKIYKPTIEVTNNYPEKYIYRLYFFLDYKQTHIKVENTEKSYVDLIIDPFSKEKIVFQIPKISDGRHDFVILSSRSPFILKKDDI